MLTDSPWAVGAAVRDADKARLNPTAQPWDEVPKKPKPWKVTARWESAAPIQDALAAVPNSDFENFYVINLLGDTRITGLLLQDRKLGDKLTVIRGSTTLDADDKQLWLDKLDEASHDSKRALLFYFRRRPPITEEVQHLWFATRIGAFELLAKFDAREMHYQGKLAL